MRTFEANTDFSLTRRRIPGNVCANSLLGALPNEDLRLIEPHLKVTDFAFDTELYEFGSSVEHLYFPLDCVISSLILMEDGCAIETAMTGREGLVGVASLLGRSESRLWTRVSIAGSAAALDRKFLNTKFSESPAIQKIVLSAYRRLITQVSQRAVCNARHSILEKLCCWLLMVHDRIGDDDLKLTQEAISMRLGSRRAGITQAATVLRAMKAISYVRGSIFITDRGVLETAACECYQTFRTDFDNPSQVSSPLLRSM